MIAEDAGSLRGIMEAEADMEVELAVVSVQRKLQDMRSFAVQSVAVQGLQGERGLVVLVPGVSRQTALMEFARSARKNARSLKLCVSDAGIGVCTVKADVRIA